MRKKAVKWAFLAVFIALIMVVPVGATTISELQKKQQELRRQQEEVRRQRAAEQSQLNEIALNISGLEHEADDILAEIEGLDESLVMIMASVDMILDEIFVKEEDIAITTALYEQAQLIEAAQYEGMKLRIKHMYETSDVSLLEVLIESNSLSELLNRLEYMEKLNDYDGLQLDAYIKAKEETEELKEQLEDEKAGLLAQQHELEEEKGELERLLSEKRELFENYEVLIAGARQQAAVFSANIRNQNQRINQLAAQEAEVKAQEIAAVKAAEAAKQGTSGAGGNYASPGSFTGSTGERISAYAVQFVGNPYVAGGTSLTNGADCSGFIWRVFRDFGYNVPRTSFAFRSAGTGVEYSEAKPGDIICYAGHVGIFIGNGRIVHASTERTGIIITNAAYRPILAVRRLV
ncbi:MAG: NlpC/P60 family protein [Lachnospiraceae bacterium]|nr:NlpC/P60 family protein [Lachnospiraceae bacterium]